jgi:phosphoadenosine phosphosulfate reductase
MASRKTKKAREVIKANYDIGAGIFFKGGKETMVMLHMMREMYGDLPNVHIFLDNGREQKELYKFIKKIEKKWKLNLKTYMFFSDEDKIGKVKYSIRYNRLKKVFIAIRRDENPARANENYVVKKEEDTHREHLRIHPMLEFTEEDIWKYIKKHNVPYCNLYDKGWKSVGDSAKKSKGDERSGRDPEKERIMKKLREMGYF